MFVFVMKPGPHGSRVSLLGQQDGLHVAFERDWPLGHRHTVDMERGEFMNRCCRKRTLISYWISLDRESDIHCRAMCIARSGAHSMSKGPFSFMRQTGQNAMVRRELGATVTIPTS